jgi:hypothetical protein
MVISMILSVAILLPTTVISGFQTSLPPYAFGQFMTDRTNEGNTSSASGIRNNNNSNDSDNNITDQNIVAASTTTAINNTSAVPSNNMTETFPTITIRDVSNSTYIASKEADQDGSDRRIARAIRDRINDLTHTLVPSNATIISNATLTNDFTRESTTTINNYTRFLEVLPVQVEIALSAIMATKSLSQPANSMLELHTDIETMCISNSTSVANCDINIRIH